MATAIPFIQSGHLVAVAIGSPRRFGGLPDVPTISESGLPNFEAGTWGGLMLPHNTPAPVLAKLRADLTQVIESPQFKAKLLHMGAELGNVPAADFGKKVAADYRKNACALKNQC